jgi:hypothetical protein
VGKNVIRVFEKMLMETFGCKGGNVREGWRTMYTEGLGKFDPSPK